ncbi:Fucose permease [Thermomonospora echinospora]|uniref:Fucose permease n=1 Tax=Thermomonospora echinospora TaxID=1992 RepID=A0A1H6BI73_9ACTN|nr:MFS transporter [Thermomonospora echinospora]SEG60067.1 Fucose permease [Thermomonospora echinospora]
MVSATAAWRHSARAAVTTAFLAHGLVGAVWLARIPQIKQELGLTEGSLGLALLGGPIGVVAAVRFAGRIVARWGSRAATRVAGVAMALALVPLGLAWNLGSLMVALALLGAATGLTDVAMNAQGVAVERERARPLMSGLHGAWSIGALIGALVGTTAAHLEVPVRAHLASAAALLAVLMLVGTRGLLGASAELPVENDGDGNAHGAPARSARWTLVLLGVIGLCSFLGEGATADWSAVYLRETLGTGAGTAGLGYAGCAVAMAAARLAGDRVITAFGPVLVLRVGGLVAAAALAAGLLAGTPVAAVMGFTLYGLGVAVVAPVTFGAAGNLPGVPAATGISWATSIGYSGFLAGPPVIGFVAQGVGLTWALAIPVALALMIVALAGVTRPARR